MSILNLDNLTNEQIEEEAAALIKELEKRADAGDLYSYEIDTRRHYVHWTASSMSC